jgi:transposase
MSEDLKETVVRGSYSIPRKEYDTLETLVTKFSLIKPPLKKSELIRIGIYEVGELKESHVRKRLKEIGRLNVGKPRKIHVKGLSDSKQASYEMLKINDAQWREIKSVLPLEKKKRGKAKEDARSVINGILFIFGLEKQRRKMPPEFPSFSTCWRRLKEWQENGTWKPICRILIDFSDLSQKRLQTDTILRTLLIETKS